MLMEQLNLIKEIGVEAAALVALFYILRMVLTWSHKQAEKTLQLAEDTSLRILDLANITIQKNTESLGAMHSSLIKMQETLVDHIRQKERFVESLKDCKHDRDNSFKDIKESISKKR